MLRGPEFPPAPPWCAVNWADNPWFPAELDQERLDCLRISPDQYAHIWEGGYAARC